MMVMSGTASRRAMIGGAGALAVTAASKPVWGADRPTFGPPPATLSPAQAQSDIELMARALRTIHPGLTRHAPAPVIDRSLEDLRQSLARPVSDQDLYLRIAGMLALIRCSHTKAEPPEAVSNWRTDNPSHLPLRFRILEGQVVVVSSDPAQNGPPRGSIITHLDGQPASRAIRALSDLCAIDGFTEPTRQVLMADDGDLAGCDYDHYAPFVRGWRPDVALRWRDPVTGRGRQERLRRIGFAAWQQLPNDRGGYRQNFGTDTSWRMAAPDVGLLRIPTFVNYRRPADAAALYARALGELLGAGMQRLVIDLRDNGGGSDDAALALIDAVATAPYVYQSAVSLRRPRYGDLAASIQTWGDREAIFNPPLENYTERSGGWYDLKPELAPAILMPRNPAPSAFPGPVTVLVSPANQSGATMVVSRLKAMGRVRLVGQPTGGSADGPTAGRVFMLRLPASGITVRIPQIWNRMGDPPVPPGRGVAPDQLVTPTVADFRAGRDAALELALRP